MASRLFLIVCVCFGLISCEGGKRSEIDTKPYTTDLYVSIAQHTMVLPFIAWEDYAYRQQSFSFDPKGDAESAIEASRKLLRDSAARESPLAVDSLSVVVRTYGWSDSSNIRADEMCMRLSRKWARSACDNPWAAIQQALPANRFMLVDLSRLQIGDPRGPAHCIDDGNPRRPLPQSLGQSVMICEAQVSGGDKDEFHRAVVRIDGDLGALWTVWRHGQNGETAEAMTEREGKAIVAFVRYGLGPSENFQILNDTVCGLRRPGSQDSPKGTDCPNMALPMPTRNTN